MIHLVSGIDKFTQISDKLAVSGQPSEEQFKLIKEAGYQIVLRLKIEGLDSIIVNEEQVVLENGLMYEEIPIALNNPGKTNFEHFACILNRSQNLKVYIHCTSGYCASGMLIPYLMLYKNHTKADATRKVIVNQFDTRWHNFIEETIIDLQATTN